MKTFILFLSLYFFSLIIPASVIASCNFYTSMTSSNKNIANWNTTCTVSSIEGIDDAQNLDSSTTNSASLNLTSGGSITINSTGVLTVGSLLLSGGNTAIQTGGAIKAGAPIYVTDSDLDGWPLNFTLYNATASGKRRLGLMRSFTTIDCNDNNDFKLDNQCCVSSTYYRDLDGDGFGAGNPITMCATTGYVTNNSDCGPNTASAYPGSAACSSATFLNASGASTRDYNCNGSDSICGAQYYYGGGGREEVRKTCGTTVKVCCGQGSYCTDGIAGPVGCGVAGYTAGPSVQCGGCSAYYTLMGSYGVQACQ
ncbi:MAG TPA: hypothetical protein VFI61_00160 [Patescibacteria group bacterium]|nr:hypothetical protein [Patescibacteria group bacterium]